MKAIYAFVFLSAFIALGQLVDYIQWVNHERIIIYTQETLALAIIWFVMGCFAINGIIKRKDEH